MQGLHEPIPFMLKCFLKSRNSHTFRDFVIDQVVKIDTVIESVKIYALS